MVGENNECKREKERKDSRKSVTCSAVPSAPLISLKNESHISLIVIGERFRKGMI